MPRGRPKEFDRDDALDCALSAFLQHGFASTGMGDLTEAMSIGRQSLYDTFGDKRSLFLEALHSYCDRQSLMFEQMFASAPSPGVALAQFLDSWPEMLSGHMSNGCLVLNSITEFVGSGDPEIMRALAEQVDRMARCFEDVIQRAKDSGEIDLDLPARDMAMTLQSAANGLMLKSRLSGAGVAAGDVSRALKAMFGLS